MEDLRSDRALVCRQERFTEAGPGEWFYVLMADGFLLDCGYQRGAFDRAVEVAAALNADHPEGEGHE